MLVPRGRLATDGGGLDSQLFVMISKYDDDHVEQDVNGACSEASAYCGIRNRLYPDKRNMGFPFDRPSATDDKVLTAFLLPNMKVADCKIIFTDEIVERASAAPTENNKIENKNWNWIELHANEREMCFSSLYLWLSCMIWTAD